MPAPAPSATVAPVLRPANVFDGGSALAREAACDESNASFGPDLVALAKASARPDMGNAHPLTKWVYGWLRDRSPQDKRLVFEAASQRAGVGCTTEKQERAYAAVEVFVDSYGYVPAAKEWDLWRKTLPDDAPKPPSAGFIRNAFGDWPAVREAFGAVVPRADALAHHELLSRNEHFSEDQLRELFLEWARGTGGPLFQYELIDWCRSVPRGRGRPYHWNAFRLRFATWEKLLESAGLLHRRGVGRKPSAEQVRRKAARERDAHQRAETLALPKAARRAEAELRATTKAEREQLRSLRAAERQAETERRAAEKEERRHQQEALAIARPPSAVDCVPPRRRTGASDAELLELLTTWAGTSDGPLRYDAFEGYLAALPKGSPARSYTPFRHRFGSWPQLLAHAGMADRSLAAAAAEKRLSRPKAPPQAPRTDPGTDLQVKLRWVRHAGRRLSARMSYPQYDDWRARLQLAALRNGREIPAIPSSGDLKRCCGSWPLVKVAAGLLTLADLADQPDRTSHSLRQMREYFLEAREACPSDLDEWAYSHWRRSRRRELLAEGRADVRIPSADHLRLHFGGPDETWEQVTVELGSGGVA